MYSLFLQHEHSELSPPPPPHQHTWGLPTINDKVNYTNAQFHAARGSGEAIYMESEASWAEQRVFFDFAVTALGDHPLAAAIRGALPPLPQLPAPAAAGYHPAALGGAAYSIAIDGGGTVLLGFDAGEGVRGDGGSL